MNLNLMNPKAYLLASELARLTGESLTDAVIVALEQRLEAERTKIGSGRTAETILAFAKRFSPGINPGSHSSDHGVMFDDSGLPH